MHLDVVDLRAFYYTTPLGRATRRILQARLRAMWPDIAGQRLLGLGYAAPFLRPFKDEVTHLACAMPAGQGAMAWPPEGPCVSLLSQDNMLPLPDASIDRVLAVHSLEYSLDLQGLISEVWRVLSDDGRLLVVVPNRRSVWARAESTPFGHGRPYSRSQIKRLLGEHGFTPLELEEALFMPPMARAMVLRSAVTLERLGRRLLPGFGAAVMLEVRKEIYQPVGRLKPARLRARKPALAPTPATPRGYGRDGTCR